MSLIPILGKGNSFPDMMMHALNGFINATRLDVFKIICHISVYKLDHPYKIDNIIVIDIHLCYTM